ncbi:Mediator of RNA polymerase II transcription subunit 11 [Cardamine amara subsp. amara]|uniref:Mediator of RNA polymerase II transcription subunit 11 n=1 Tax=Cardamine amara subsp. amara TaxID=228776 RepID=A0ABD1C6G3_CARAN
MLAIEVLLEYRAKFYEDTDGKKQELKVSSIDFIGLGFADKRNTRGLPPGLVPVVDYLLDGDSPEVKFIVGDKTRFVQTEKKLEQDGDGNSDVFIPKFLHGEYSQDQATSLRQYVIGPSHDPGGVMEELASPSELKKEFVNSHCREFMQSMKAAYSVSSSLPLAFHLHYLAYGL